MARFWWAAISDRTASAARRATASPGSMPRPAWLIRSTQTRTILSNRSRSRPTARSWRAVISTTSADNRAGALPGSMPRPAWPIRSTRTQRRWYCGRHHLLSRGAGGRQDSGERRFHRIGGQTRNRIARLDPTTGLADSFNPNANDCGPFNRGPGGRQDSGGRLFHKRRSADSDAQPHRPAGNRRQARPDAQSRHRG